ncbi:MAG: Gx transporter family protein [Acetatifactor sp.]|nr:Gx transporter family protein [Acetatifactor sp.]
MNDSRKNNDGLSVQRLTALSLLTAAALMIYAMESMLPTLIPVPGIKLGLANVVTLITLKRLGVRDALLVLLARILLSACFFGSLLSLLYSLSGGLFCLLILWLVNRLLAGHYLFLTSITGAIAHNLAQITVAFFLTSVGGVFVYLPFLMISACLTGLFTGLCAHFTLKNLPPFKNERF